MAMEHQKHVLKQVLNFAKRYVALLCENLSSRFDCFTLKLCKIFPMTLDTSSHFSPSSINSVDYPFPSIDTFSEAEDDIPFVSKNKQERETLLFRLRITTSDLVDLATQVGIKRKVDHFSSVTRGGGGPPRVTAV